MSYPMVLTIAASLVGFLLKSSLCFAAALILARLIPSPSRRFALWFSYLIGCFAYAATLALLIALPIARSLFATTHAAAEPAANAIARASANPSLTAPATVLATAATWSIPTALAPAATFLLVLAAAAYCIAVLAAFALHLRRRFHLRRALLYAYDPPADLAALAHSLAGSTDLRPETRARAIRIRILPGLDSPGTIGWRRPTILLPPASESQPLDQTADILQHELHHIRRRDWLLERLACTARALLFFQPAMTLALRHLRLERELACDQAVLRSQLPFQPESRIHYAESLLQVARLARTAALTLDPAITSDPAHAYEAALPGGVIRFAAHTSQLETRLRAILARPGVYPKGLRGLVALTNVAVLCIVSACLPWLTVTFAFTPARPALSPANRADYRANDRAALPSPPSTNPTSTADRNGQPAVRRAITPTEALLAAHPHREPQADPPTRTPTRSWSATSANISAATSEPALSAQLLHDLDAPASSRTQLQLEPAAGTQDSLPATAASSSPGSGSDNAGGALTPATNPALQTAYPSHSIVTILSDAAVQLARKGPDHDSH